VCEYAVCVCVCACMCASRCSNAQLSLSHLAVLDLFIVRPSAGTSVSWHHFVK